jgi:hypothetical protein
MKNVIPPNTIVNEKYDIKGSWVGRNASPSLATKKKKSLFFTCKHCNEQYNEALYINKNCSAVLGGHEAIVTMKDNDMTDKIRLFPEHAFKAIETLLSDSDALCDMGVTDYSLLIGITNTQYNIDTLPTTNYCDNSKLTNKKNSIDFTKDSYLKQPNKPIDLIKEDASFSEVDEMFLPVIFFQFVL